MQKGWNINELMVRHTMLVRAIGLFAGALGLFLFAIIPLFGSTQQKIVKIRARQKEANTLADRVTILSQLDTNVLENRVRILDQALPPRKDVVAYLSAIDGLSRELGLSFGGITITPGDVTEKNTVSKGKGGLSSLDTTIKIQGDETGIYAFLKSVEQVMPLMEVKDVKVTKNGNQYALSLTLAMLYAPAATGDVKGQVSLFNEKEEAYFQILQGYKHYEAAGGGDTSATAGKTDLFSK
jgi:hypothetical protein